MKEKLLENRKLIDIVIVIVVGGILCIPLLNSNVNVYFDDGIQHIARAFGTYSSIMENRLFPNVISSFTNDFGYSWNLFYGPLSSYGIILIKLICNNYLIAYKLFVCIALILSGMSMHKFIFGITKNNDSALLAGILYMSFPYHLTDLYSRNATRRICIFYFYTTCVFRII